MARLVPIMLAGGAGKRLAGLQADYPKQFLPLLNAEKTLLQQTAERALTLAPADQIITVTSAEHAEFAQAQLAEIDTELTLHIITEPCRRNTAAAIALAALHAQEAFDDPVLCVLPCDHYIGDEAAFQKAVKEAEALARKGHIVTFGIVPRTPSPAYGYMLAVQNAGLLHVRRFIEKPEAEVAATLMRDPQCYLNSGMFVMSAEILLAELAAHAPDIATAAHWAFINGMDVQSYARIPALPIDRAVMERSQRVCVIPATFDWADIGNPETLQATRQHLGMAESA